MISTSDILNLVSAYLDKKQTLDEFALHFAELFYDIENGGTPDAVQLAYSIETKLADLSAGLCSLQDLDSLLSAHSPVNVAPAKSPSPQVAGAEQIMYAVASVFSDKSLVMGFGSTLLLRQAPRTNTDQAPSQQEAQV